MANISYHGRYLRNAATFKDVRSGEHGLELFKVSLSKKKTYFNFTPLENQELMYFLQGDMKGHVDKYDWTYKGEDTYTLTIKNPTVDEEGTYSVSIAVDVVKKDKKGFNVLFQLIVRELDNMKTGCYLTVKGGNNRKFILYDI